MPRYRKTPKGWLSADIYWFVANKKRAIAYSTKATADLIMTLTKPGDTITDVYTKILFDEEAKKVLRAYMNHGFGNLRML